MGTILKQYAARVIVAVAFALAGPILVKLGLTQDTLYEIVLTLLGGGVSVALILSMIKKAFFTDPPRQR